MIKFSLTIPSQTLHRPVTVVGALPYGLMQNFSKLKVIWALHCAMEDGHFFFDKLGIGEFVDKHQIAIIAPSLGNGFFINSYVEQQSDFLILELFPALRELLPLSPNREDNYLLGISMGAFGASLWSFLAPETFSKVSLLSGIFFNHLEVDPRARKKRELRPFVHLFSDGVMSFLMQEKSILEQTDIRPLFQQKQEIRPQYLLVHGTEDFLSMQQSQLFKEYGDANLIDVTLILKDGGHNVAFWKESIKDCLHFFLLKKEH